jgi:hypothetical protein
VTVIVLLITRPTVDRGSEDFRPRGPANNVTLFDGRPPGARVFCVGDDPAGTRRVLADARATESSLPIPTVRCKLTESLQLAYSTPSLEGLTMVVFSQDSAGEIFWYAPRRAGDMALPVVPDAIGRPLDWSTRLGVNHTPGAYDLRVLFFDRPVPAEAAASGQVTPIQALRVHLELEAQP